MNMFQHIARAATMGDIAVLVAASLAAAEERGRYWVPTTTNAATYWVPSTTSPATHQPSIATRSTKRFATKHMRKRSPLAAMARSAPDPKAHRLILQVNTNDPAAMNLALNNATNVTQHFKELSEKVKIEVVTFGPGLHMLRDDTLPVKARIEEMALSTPEVSFKACGNTQEKNAQGREQGHTDYSSGQSGEVRRGARDGAAGEGLELRKTVSEAPAPIVWHAPAQGPYRRRGIGDAVCTKNLIRIYQVTESAKLAR